MKRFLGLAVGRHQKTIGYRQKCLKSMEEVTRARQLIGETSDSKNDFSVVSYNLLADCHMSKRWYSFTPSGHYYSSERHPQLIEELQVLDGDIICLQEVGSKYYEKILKPSLRKLGYNGVFVEKSNFWYSEGEATFFKTNKFELLAKRSYTFNEMLRSLVEAKITANRREILKRAVRPQVFLILQLKHITTQEILSIGNVHCIFGPVKLDVNALYTALAMEKLLELAQGGAHIIAGDFNSPTDKQTYKLLANGKLSETELDKLNKMNSVRLKHTSLSEVLKDFYTHDSKSLKSSYFEVMAREPTFTCVDSRKTHKCNCDYIWFSSDHLTAVNALDVNDIEPVKGDIRIPNGIYPSDHLSIKTTLSFKEKTPNCRI